MVVITQVMSTGFSYSQFGMNRTQLCIYVDQITDQVYKMKINLCRDIS